MQVTLGVAQGYLNLSGTAGLTITGAGNNSPSMTLTGTVAAIDSALEGLTYTLNSDASDDDTLSIVLDDVGTSGPREIAASVAINPTYAYPNPIIWNNIYNPTTLPAPVVTIPGGTFQAVGTPVNITGVSVAGAALVNINLSVQSGTLSIPQSAGVQVQDGGTSSIEISGSVADVNTALAKLTYTGNAGYSGGDGLTVSATAVGELLPAPDQLTPNPPSYPLNPGAVYNPPPVSTNPISGGGFSVGTPLTVTSLGGTSTTLTDTITGTPVSFTSASTASTASAVSTVSASVATINPLNSYPVQQGPGYLTLGQSSTNTVTLALNVAPPTINVPPAQKITGLLPLVFSTSGGNAITVSDSDVGTNPIQVTLSVQNGTLSLASTAGLTFSKGTGTGDTTMTFTGEVSDVAQALDGLTYSATAGFTGADTLSISASDLGGTGGSPIVVNDSVAIHVQQIVPPTITISLPTSTVAITPAGGSIPGVSVNVSGSAILQVTLSVQDGTLTVPYQSNVSITGTGTSTVVLTGTAAAIDAALQAINSPPLPTPYYPGRPVEFVSVDGPESGGLMYTPTSGFTGTDTLAVSAKEADLANAPTTTGSLSINVEPPTINVPAAQTMNAATPLVFSTAGGNAVSITQADVGNGPIQVSLSVADGTLTLASTAGLIFTTGNGTSNAAMTFSGDTSDVNAALAGLSYLAGSGFSGNDKLIVSVGTPGGSSTTANASVAICVQQGTPPTVTVTLPTAPVAVQPVGDEISIAMISINGNQFAFGNVQITFSAQHGTLTFPAGDGVTVTGEGTSSITISGSAAAIDTASVTEEYPGIYSLTASQTNVPAPIYDGLFYTPDSGYSGPDTLTATSKSVDIANGATTTQTVALNDLPAAQPVVTPSGNQATFTQRGAAVVVDSGIQVTCTNPLISGATMTISPATLEPGDQLNYAETSGIFGSYVGGVLTLWGNATAAEYAKALQSVTFSTTSTSTVSRSISVVAGDAWLSSNPAGEQVLIAGGADPTFTSNPHGTSQTARAGLLAAGYHSIQSQTPTSGGGSQTATPGFNYCPPPQPTGGSSSGVGKSGSSGERHIRRRAARPSLRPCRQSIRRLRPGRFLLLMF